MHYRAGPAPTARQLTDIDNRWIEQICATAVERSPGPLLHRREARDQVGGCCRDHTLLAVAILRQHGIAARSRVGFAGYLHPEFHHDHVVGERWCAQEQRWVRFDPEFAADDLDLPMHDLPRGPEAPFQSGADAWLAYRARQIDPHTYGVDPQRLGERGAGFIQWYVLADLAHLMGTELLLWDVWDHAVTATMAGELGANGPDGALSGAPRPTPVAESLIDMTDHLAHLIRAADDDEAGAATELARIWRTEEILRPGQYLRTLSPTGRIGTTDLHARRTVWDPAGVPT